MPTKKGVLVYSSMSIFEIRHLKCVIPFFFQVYRKYGKEYGGKTNPNISFQFYVPRNKSLTDSSPRGKWAPLATPCSVTCGLGK